MPTVNEHLDKGKHNEEFASSFDVGRTPFLDWVVTGAFYAALHYIDSFLAQRNIHPGSHDVRDRKVSRIHQLSPIYREYRSLKDDSTGARYRMQRFTPLEIRHQIYPKLAIIKTHLRQHLPQIP